MKTIKTRRCAEELGVMGIILAGVLAFGTVACGTADEPASGKPPGPAGVKTDHLQCGSAELYSLTHDGCGGMDAVGDGACFCFLGYAWNGAACVGVNGCECQGTDCDKLSQSLEECQAAHTTCGV